MEKSKVPDIITFKERGFVMIDTLQFIISITITILIIINVFFKKLKVLNEFIFLMPMALVIINTNFKNMDFIILIAYILACASLTMFIFLKVSEIKERNKNSKE